MATTPARIPPSGEAVGTAQPRSSSQPRSPQSPQQPRAPQPPRSPQAPKPPAGTSKEVEALGASDTDRPPAGSELPDDTEVGVLSSPSGKEALKAYRAAAPPFNDATAIGTPPDP